jgi:membrane peptidoglycan carboxypeptidase
MSVGVPAWWGPYLTRKVGRFRALPVIARTLRHPVFISAVIVAALAAAEMRWSWLQSRMLALISARMTYKVDPGPSPAFATAPAGPYDQRLGYTAIPEILQRTAGAYRIARQARSSESMLGLTAAGGYPVYPEKSQAGLAILDRAGKALFAARYPRHVYQDFDAIPPLVVRTLLYIENRKILDDDSPYLNPAVEWNRLAKAAGDLAISKVYPAHPISGGSTLATQLEKVRHSPGGRTASTLEKFRQMLAASLRAYRNGEDTTQTRRDIVRDYLNSFPLSAVPGYGEVAGLQEGLMVWFGADPAEVNRLLALPLDKADSRVAREQARAYRQVLSLLLALNRPDYYLRHDQAALDARTDSYLRLFAQEGIIPERFSKLALETRLTLRRRFEGSNPEPAGDKGTLALRADLLAALGVPDAYALDRMDLTVGSTLDGESQRRICQELSRLRDPDYAAAAGLTGANLLSPGSTGSVIFSFTLYEQSAGGNLLRIECDNYDQPLSINRGTRLELGSTAKLRTLVTYLEIVAGLYEQHRGASPKELRTARAQARDRITAWAISYLLENPESDLTGMLEAALDRPYSASTEEKFFTGGGLHTFSNFDRRDNGAVLSVRQGFRRSVNLVFIRLMRDIADYYAWRLPGASPRMLSDPNDPQRAAYLARFADQEGRVFLEQFWNRHRGRTPAQSLEVLGKEANSNLRRLTMIFRSVRPESSLAELGAYLRARTGTMLSEDWVQELARDYDPERFNWNDRGYLAGVHPLELWLLRFLHEHPNANFAEAADASKDVRQEVYAWLFQKRNVQAQNLRIRTVLEQDAFAEILKSWKRQGFPFSDIVPSYASALGSSGDNPAALAELAGIILNDGVRKPTVRVNEIHIAEGTPYETLLERTPPASVRVYPVELARVVKNAMFDVVENGTGRRAYQSVFLDDKTALPVGGKTGTGDNRLEIRGPGGIVDSRVRNRTATFVFVIGDRFFGTLTAYVPGDAAEQFRFTSALPVQLFRQLAPHFESVVRTTGNGPAGKGETLAGFPVPASSERRQ